MDEGDKTGSEDRGGQGLDARYGYYRRCQQVRRKGEQCKAPAMKGELLCYKHEQQAEKQRRHERFVLPPLTDFNAVRKALCQVAQAIIDGRIEHDHAGELLHRLQNASLQLRDLSRLPVRHG
jgi:hypothetical protein